MFNARKRYGLPIVLVLIIAMLAYAVYGIGGTGQLMVTPTPQFFANKGAGNNMQACSGCAVSFYLTGTTTPQNTYTDSGLTTPNPNPIVLNSRGEAPNPIWLNGTYTMVLRTAAGANTVIWSRDNIGGVVISSGSANIPTVWTTAGVAPTYINATSFSFPGDQTGIMLMDTRLQMVITAGAIYGRVASAVYAAGVTTVTVVNDSTPLDSSLSAVSYSVLQPNSKYALTFHSIDPASKIDSTGAANFAGPVNILGALNTLGPIGAVNFSGPVNIAGALNVSGPSNLFGLVGSANFTGTTTVQNLVISGSSANVNIAGSGNGLATLDAGGNLAQTSYHMGMGVLNAPGAVNGEIGAGGSNTLARWNVGSLNAGALINLSAYIVFKSGSGGGTISTTALLGRENGITLQCNTGSSNIELTYLMSPSGQIASGYLQGLCTAQSTGALNLIISGQSTLGGPNVNMTAYPSVTLWNTK